MIPMLLETYPTAPLRKLRAAVDAGDMRDAARQLDALRRQAAVQLACAVLLSAAAALLAWSLL